MDTPHQLTTMALPGQSTPLQEIAEIRNLERLCNTLPSELSRLALGEIILERKRRLKGTLEAEEKQADNLDKLSLQLAGFCFAVASWSTSSTHHFFQDPWNLVIEVIWCALGILSWARCRYLSVTIAKAARVALALLGKVE